MNAQRIEARAEGDPRFDLADTTFVLAEAGGWSVPPAGAAGVGPAIRASTTVER